MRVKREDLLNDLNAVKAGLSPREFIEQSSCFVFQDGMVMTFNDEVACRKKIGIKVTGAVPAANLLAILEKMDDDILKVEENEKGELEFRGKRKRFGVTKDSDIFLPIDRVEMPSEWHELKPLMVKAIDKVRQCVSGDESRFTLTCIHLHPEFVEACDNLQIMRCQVKTGLPQEILIRGSSMSSATSLGMDEISITNTWIHFRNSDNGLIFSCRRYDDQYPKLDEFMKIKGHKITIPRGLKEASERASIFAADKSGEPSVRVSISNGLIRLTGEGLSGWYEEKKKVAYEGPSMQFLIAPGLLSDIAEHYTDAEMTSDKLRMMGQEDRLRWEYITVLGSAEEPEETAEEPEEEETPKKKKKKVESEEDDIAL